MKRWLVSLAVLLAIGFAAVPSSTHAAAYRTAFAVSITYMNVSSLPANVVVDFYPENTATPTQFTIGALPSKASGSLAVGSVSSLARGFKGSAVLSADQPILATVVQVDPAGLVKNRPLSNGFSSGDSASKQLLATVLKNSFNYTTIFSVQNTEAFPIDATVRFFAVGQTTAKTSLSLPRIPAGAAKYVDAGTIVALGATFSGSAIITAVRSGTSTGANIVVTANELQVNGAGSTSFEGTSRSGAKVYMPSALCQVNVDAGKASTFYAVQNASLTSPVSFRIRYRPAGTTTDRATRVYTLAAGGKQSLNGCEGIPVGRSGSAIIERTAGTGTLVAVGKASGGGLTTTFLGAVEGSGSANIAAPYIRWSPNSTYYAGTRQRAFIDIQNAGTVSATTVLVQYVDRNGRVLGTHNIGTIAVGAKATSTPALGRALDSFGRFGEYGPALLGTSFGGGAIITAGSGSLAVVVRITSLGTGEDYNGLNIP